jgi:competence protein ComGC
LHYEGGGGVRAALSLLGLVIVLAIIWMVIKTQITHGPSGGTPPKQVIDVVGVKTDLMAIGQAERLYLASHGTYASLDQLQQDGAISFSGAHRRGYNYTAEVNDGQHFKITAAPSGSAQEGWPTLSIDENMQVTQE